MPGIKELKNRIKSVSSTRKITKAMQMVSAAKMRKSQQAALNSRTYASLAWELIEDLGGIESMSHPLLNSEQKMETKGSQNKIGVVVISSNKGLVGSLNTNLVNKLKELEQRDPSASPLASASAQDDNFKTKTMSFEIITFGKKASQAMARMGKNMIADFPKPERTISAEEVYPLVQNITQVYLTGQYKSIYLVYNHFVSTLAQKPMIKQLLPFLNHQTSPQPSPSIGEGGYLEYAFEPTPEQVLEHLLPRILESQVYEAILESDASEHSARMVMMKNATEAAGDLISDLTLTFNQLRQGKITTELAEITAGRIALE